MFIFALVATATIPQDALQTINAANKAWLPAMERQDAAAVAEPYAEDGVFVAATGETAHGRNAIEQLMRDRFAKSGRVVGGTLVQDGTAAAGSMIYEWGHADLELAREGQAPAHVRGRYLTVWQRISGKWRIVRNLSLPD